MQVCNQVCNQVGEGGEGWWWRYGYEGNGVTTTSWDSGVGIFYGARGARGL